MRCLVVGDLHFNLRQFDWITERLVDFDALVLTGDLLDLSGHQPHSRQLQTLLPLLQRWRARTHVLVASGNHDAVDRPHREDWLAIAGAAGCFVDGATVVFDRASFTLCPWRDDPQAEGALARLLAHAPVPDDRPWIWVHHEPPAGAAVSWAGRIARGNAGLARMVRRLRPHLVLSGHIHDAPFVEGGAWLDRMGPTWLVNPGRQPGDAPAHAVLDLAREEVTWAAAGGSDRRRLDLARPLPRPAAAAAVVYG